MLNAHNHIFTYANLFAVIISKRAFIISIFCVVLYEFYAVPTKENV